MVWLAIDFGERRIGLAVSDAEHRLALPLLVLERRSDRRAVAEIAALARQYRAEALVVGVPRRPDDGRESAGAPRARAFADKLAARTGLPIIPVEETLTTDEARRRLVAAGRRTDDPSRLDAVAAQILLEEALERERRERAPAEGAG